jgi:hypothetical protein
VRDVSILAAILVAAIPVLLIVATWEPLESPPRRARPAQVEDGVEREAERRGERREEDRPGESRTRKDRDQDNAPPASSTPHPAISSEATTGSL